MAATATQENFFYKAMAISTAHLSEADIQALHTAANDASNNRVLSRATGFLIKLPECSAYVMSAEYLNGHETLRQIILYAVAQGCRLLEFDEAADPHPAFKA